MRKTLIIVAHIAIGVYGMLYIGFGDLATLTSNGTFYQTGTARSIFNVLMFAFFYPRVQESLFGGCLFTKLQAREERRIGEEQTERFLPPWFKTEYLSFAIVVAFVRSSIPLWLLYF